MRVYLNNRGVALNPSQIVGEGGEAVVYCLGNGSALKLFKDQTHPDFAGDSTQQWAVQQRLDQYQYKLRNFPKNLPSQVVVPLELLTDKSATRVLGYSMQYIEQAELIYRYSEPAFHPSLSSHMQIVRILTDLHRTLAELHQAGVVVGDLNDLNILVKNQKCYLIDADSYQFGNYPCSVFTERFIDPLLCSGNDLKPQIPFSAASDWYAFAVIAFRSLLAVDPYGGVIKPTLSRLERVAKRLTVFNPSVHYPKVAKPLNILSNELLDQFQRIFERDQRSIFPIESLSTLAWQRCKSCKLEHTRSRCPTCHPQAAIKPQIVIRVKGNLRIEKLFETTGTILHAKQTPQGLAWLYQEGLILKRESGEIVAEGIHNPRMHLALQGKRTLLGQGGQFAVIEHGQAPKRYVCDLADGQPVFTANSKRYYWLDGGVLKCNESLGERRIGELLQNQTRLWVGEELGFGFYRAGELSRAYIFDTEAGVVNDSLAFRISGQLLSAHAFCRDSHCWLATTTRTLGREDHRLQVYFRTGELRLVKTLQQELPQGFCVAGNKLFVPTDQGLVRYDLVAEDLLLAKEFPDTEEYCSSGSKLFLMPDGLYVVDSTKVLKLVLG